MIEVTAEMEDAFDRASFSGSQQITGNTVRGLEAVFALLDPVPDDVRRIKDSDGDEWVKTQDDPRVWRVEYGDVIGTFAWIDKKYGPVTW